MASAQRKLTKTFKEFFNDQKTGGIMLIVCTIISLIITNSPFGSNYLALWQSYLGGLSIE
ncbi:MAG: Na+/H+ antiporter NhaA, partial [Blastocatellia bacterium]|nr:Na+/H+ antiporter NhaA [Blastocatellia bacterium]